MIATARIKMPEISSRSLRKPSRPPPPPPLSAGVASHRDDYIKISDCHTGAPERPPKPIKPRARESTSFSSTSSSSNFANLSASHSHHHQKSRSLIDNKYACSYLYLDLPRSPNTIAPTNSSTVYKQVDFLRTEALNKCKVERNKADC